MFDFRRFKRDANGSMVQMTAKIAGVLAVFSIGAVGLLSNTVVSDDRMRQFARIVSAPDSSMASEPRHGWRSVDQTATAAIPQRAKANPSGDAACANMAKIVTTYRMIGPDGEIVTMTETMPKGAGASTGSSACGE